MRTRPPLHNLPALVAFHLGYIYGDNTPEGFLAYYRQIDELMTGFDDTCEELGCPMPDDLDEVRHEFRAQRWAWDERARDEVQAARDRDREQYEDRLAQDRHERGWWG